MRRLSVKELLQMTGAGEMVVATGWVKTRRGNKQVSFIALNDGSTIHNIQVVAETGNFPEELLKRVTTGAALRVTGALVESAGSGQSVEIQAREITVLGEADPEKYPIQPKKHSLEFLRENAHLRFRTNIFGAVSRVSHAMSFAIHDYFNARGFYYLHAPLITASDAEGAGEMFRVTTLDPLHPPLTSSGEVDYKQDFFGKATNLTVSGQLEGELAAMALGKIYTFGPTFRAENSNTTRHLAEFWMIEPEVAFNDIHDNMDLAEDFLKFLIRYALDHCMDDLLYLGRRLQEEEKDRPASERSMELIEKLQFVLENPFARVTYTEAVELLAKSK
ncbi:MAG: asparagine--tRNA ligase, partial [Odoribacteraceae bacterium]|nr:asparagine--tRNA ligase [Odoribacteraceae bacterium]